MNRHDVSPSEHDVLQRRRFAETPYLVRCRELDLSRAHDHAQDVIESDRERDTNLVTTATMIASLGRVVLVIRRDKTLGTLAGENGDPRQSCRRT